MDKKLSGYDLLNTIESTKKDIEYYSKKVEEFSLYYSDKNGKIKEDMQFEFDSLKQKLKVAESSMKVLNILAIREEKRREMIERFDEETDSLTSYGFASLKKEEDKLEALNSSKEKLARELRSDLFDIVDTFKVTKADKERSKLVDDFKMKLAKLSRTKFDPTEQNKDIVSYATDSMFEWLLEKKDANSLMEIATYLVGGLKVYDVSDEELAKFTRKDKELSSKYEKEIKKSYSVEASSIYGILRGVFQIHGEQDYLSSKGKLLGVWESKEYLKDLYRANSIGGMTSFIYGVDHKDREKNEAIKIGMMKAFHDRAFESLKANQIESSEETSEIL